MDDENLTFETSAGVEVVGSFESLRHHGHPRRAAARHLRLRLREALGDPAARRAAHHLGAGRHRAGAVRDRQDLHDLHLRMPDRRHLPTRVSLRRLQIHLRTAYGHLSYVSFSFLSFLGFYFRSPDNFLLMHSLYQ